jgi:hypothetical protein
MSVMHERRKKLMDQTLIANLHHNPTPGDIVTFGTYPHTTDGTDRTPIQWRVLQNSGTTLLLLSEYLLDCKRYHDTCAATTWQECDLRQWLNHHFYQTAFTDAEQAAIQMTHNTHHGENSPDTDDRVFLLSSADINRLTEQLGKDFRRTIGTAFAKIKKADGCHLYVMDKNVPEDYLSVDGERVGCSWWWLRDSGRLKDKGNAPSRAVFIGTRASIRHYARVDRTGYGVRPGLVLKLHTP